jgi:hypothetical protein
MRLSSGARLDLMVLQFAVSLIQISLEKNCNDDGLVERADNKAYHVNKRIDRKLEKLQGELKETIDSLFKEGGIKTAQWVKNNLEKRIGKTLLKIQEEDINLETLAIWILFVNFCERKKQVHEKMNWLTNEVQYFDVLDMLDKTKIGHVGEAMYKTAYFAIENIKA